MEYECNAQNIKGAAKPVVAKIDVLCKYLNFLKALHKKY